MIVLKGWMLLKRHASIVDQAENSWAAAVCASPLLAEDSPNTQEMLTQQWKHSTVREGQRLSVHDRALVSVVSSRMMRRPVGISTQTGLERWLWFCLVTRNCCIACWR